VAAIFVGLLFYVLPREVRTIFKRELKSYFTSPIAYVLFVVFLGISNALSFFFTGVLEGGEADLFSERCCRGRQVGRARDPHVVSDDGPRDRHPAR
jgi:hypothetical protein